MLHLCNLLSIDVIPETYILKQIWAHGARMETYYSKKILFFGSEMSDNMLSIAISIMYRGVTKAQFM